MSSRGDFRRFWGSDAANQFGTAVSSFVLPAVAIEALDASEFQVGLLTAAGMAAFLVVGLPAGVLVDRVRKRPLLVWGTTGRALLLATVPLAGWFGGLTFAHLVLAALLAGVLTVLVDVAGQAYLPVLVDRDGLTAGNARLVSSQQVARLVGRPLGGPLVQLLGGANAVPAISASYLAAALLLRGVRAVEEPAPRRDRALWTEMGEGLRFVLGHPLLRPIALCTTSYNLTHSVWGAVNVLFLLRDLALSPTAASALLGAGSAGGALVGLAASRLRRLGTARLVWLSLLVTQPFWLLVPLTAPDWRIALFVVGTAVTSVGVVVYDVTQVSLRQSLCPPGLQGRMNATVRFLAWGASPLGALAGGALAGWIGVRDTLWVASAGMALSVLWVLLSPLRAMRDAPVITTVERHG
ncbi:MFS transporter [Saccharothrix yanglingensis]|uniref:MFS transporter n=1 Tax=Saccharothrix yanglingensis TaxID=659496 RepID=A0ABU0X0R0_9PSEU|nr:MFS transporter [Saccharothrix yanglingensis]MDQ2585714.1 MFS transporter [Saccharothrix yanglingensis]